MKHLKDYKQYITEQALPPMPGDPAAAGAAPAPPKEYLFAFVGDKEDDGIRRRKYPDGSVVIEYPTYSTTEPELQEWIKKNVISGEKQKHTDSDLEVKQKNLMEIVKGKIETKKRSQFRVKFGDVPSLYLANEFVDLKSI